MKHDELIERLQKAEGALRWLAVHIPRRGIYRILWEHLIPSACRENLEEVADAVRARGEA